MLLMYYEIASARQLKRVSVNSEGGNYHLVNYVDVVLEHCEIRRACGKAPHVPIAGTSTAPMFN